MSGIGIAEFLLARIAEAEGHWRAARRANPPYTSAYFLADCEAKRQIVREHLAHVHHYESREADGWPADAVRRDARVAGRAVEMLAAVYADHPDYREEWKP